MNRKEYVSPCAEYLLLAPAENVASDGWKWEWGAWNFYQNGVLVTPSVQGTQNIWAKPWEWDSTTDPY